MKLFYVRFESERFIEVMIVRARNFGEARIVAAAILTACSDEHHSETRELDPQGAPAVLERAVQIK